MNAPRRLRASLFGLGVALSPALASAQGAASGSVGVRGTVRDSLGQPIAGAQVSLAAPSSRNRRIPSDFLRMSLFVFAIALFPAIAAAQGVAPGTGRVRGMVHDSLGRPIAGAQVSLAGRESPAETDERGAFEVTATADGPLTVRVRRIGFHPDSMRVMVSAGQAAPLDIVLSRIAVELQAVVVMGRKHLTGPLAGFYERRARGIGRFLTRDDLEKQNQANMIDVLRTMPGVRVVTQGQFRRVVRFRGASCSPLTWVNGAPLLAGEYDLDAFDPRSFEGVEVYSGTASVPVQFLGNRNLSGECGTIVLWLREGDFRQSPRRKGAPSAAAALARLVDEKSVFTAGEVDVAARPDEAYVVHPLYPDSLYDRGIPGRVLAEFIVNASGDVVMETFSIVTATSEAFGESVRRAIRAQRYTPALRNGKPVQQVVQQPFDFVADSAKVRKR